MDDRFNFCPTRIFESKTFPGVRFELLKLTYGARRTIKHQYDSSSKSEEQDPGIHAEILWRGLVRWTNFALAVAGAQNGATAEPQPPIEDLFLHLPEALADEMSFELMRTVNPLPATDDADERIIRDAKAQIEGLQKQIAEAEARRAERKNSEPGSSPDTSTASTTTAGSASEISRKPGESEPSETATADQASDQP